MDYNQSITFKNSCLASSYMIWAYGIIIWTVYFPTTSGASALFYMWDFTYQSHINSHEGGLCPLMAGPDLGFFLHARHHLNCNCNMQLTLTLK